MFGKKKKKSAPPPEPFKSAFNTAALKEAHKQKVSGFDSFIEKYGYFQLGLGLVTLEPINLTLGLMWAGQGMFGRKGTEARNKKMFNEKSRRWQTYSGQRIEGTTFQYFLYGAAQAEILRIQENMDNSYKPHEREQGETSIKEIEAVCRADFEGITVLDAPDDVSKEHLVFARHLYEPPKPGVRLPI